MISSVTFTIPSRWRQSIAALLVLVCSPSLAYAQETWMAVNAGGQFGSNDFAHVVDLRLFRTSLRVDHPVGNGTLVDVGGGVTLPWSIGLGSVRMGLGASYSVASVGHEATLRAEIRSALIPGAPLRFDAVEAVDRSEKGAHVHFTGSVSVGERITVSVYGGPSYFAVSQDVVGDIDIPVLGVGAITRSDVRKVYATWWGFNAGADVAFFFSERFGIGFGVRVTGATVRVENLLLRTVAAERALVASRAGGVQMLGGVRLRLP